ncbi:hypothetical protein CCR75_000687 [Bremia lactucae]|uniref:TFIIS N-terminal domain-containing protein n=1 Tax=Bremia lactucae TaxID=4779 RepID=A0A976FF44_BRELC|nr:hypothetical protein CCR75_000687 [Bremia lactucae]
MEALASALEEEVRLLCEQEQTKQTILQKQRLYSRVGQFLMGSLSMQHWWCRYSPLMVFMMRVLELYPSSESIVVFYQRMEQQLSACYIYHASMPSVHVELEFEFTQDSIQAFFIKLQGLDADRVQRQLTETSMGLASALRENSETIALALYEILTQRRLLSDFRIVRVLSRWVSSRFSDVKINRKLESLRGCAGLYQLLVSPDSAVREWAQEMISHFGKIQLTGDIGDDKNFLDVMEEWMYILENEAFNKPVLQLDLRTTDNLQNFLEPTNCVKTPTKKILWSALDHVMQQLDIYGLETMLESFDTIPDLVFNFLQDADPSEDQTITLVVSKCFLALLRCLEHRFWSHCVHSPTIVYNVVMQHCRLQSWRVFVTKQFIELLPPLLVAMRPPQASSNASNQSELAFYLKTRHEILQFLIIEDLRPKHFDGIAAVALSRAAFTIVMDCYGHRMPVATNANSTSERDEGALSKSISVDYSVSDSAFWWPCGSNPGGDSQAKLEMLWMDHLYNTVVRPNNVESLVDLAAETTALVLSRHLQLARDVVYTYIVANAGDGIVSLEVFTKGRPIITDLLKNLCSWNSVTTIPIQVHGALFESIGGVSELLNCVEAQTTSSRQLQPLLDLLQKYEAHSQQYLQQMCDEVLSKGLANPFRYPIVCQHISTCYLSPTNFVSQQLKSLIGQFTAEKSQPTHLPSPLEAFLISVHRNAEAFLRGQLSMLQSMRLYGFQHAVYLPAVKKLIIAWSRVFDMLSSDLKTAFHKASVSKDLTTLSLQISDTGITANHLIKLPSLLNDFLVSLLTALFDPTVTLTVEITEATRVQCLDFGISFWKFWINSLKDPTVSSTRVIGLIHPLVECIARGSMSERKRAADLLMTVLKCLLKGNTCLDDTILSMIDSIKGEAAAIESNQSTDFGSQTKKFRQLVKSSQFFMKRSQDSNSYKASTSFTARSEAKHALDPKALRSKPKSLIRPMSGKLAARAQGYALVDLSGIEEVSNIAAARKQHSFYSEEQYNLPSKSEMAVKEQAMKKNTSFNMAQVIKGISHTHTNSIKTIQAKQLKQLKQPTNANVGEVSKEKESEDTDLRFAALFHRIKTMRKPIAICSLLPFYRQILQAAMPDLLSDDFKTENSNDELQIPSLSFKKSADYVRAFLPLLVAECSNEVQEGLRRSGYSNGGHLLRYVSEKPREGMRCLNFSIVERDEGLLASSRCKERPNNSYNEKLLRNGDIIFLQAAGESQNRSGHIRARTFLGVVLISETEKGRRQTFGTEKSSKIDVEESVSVLFLNDGELDRATTSVHAFSSELLTSSAIASSEWKVKSLCNLVTSAREYIGLRSVDMLPEHLRSVILTPDAYQSTQSELITITSALDNLRRESSNKSCAQIVKILKRLSGMNVMLTDLRSTSIGKAVNKLRKHDNADVKALSTKLKDKWTELIDQKDVLECPPRFVPSDLWEAIKHQYNNSQLQSIHSVLNNYSIGVSLLQGPPGTGKTKTIMGLLSGLLSLRLPTSAIMPISKLDAQSDDAKGGLTNREAVPTRQLKGEPKEMLTSSTAAPIFSVSALGSILCRSSNSTSTGPNRRSVQTLKNKELSRSRLEAKLSSRTNHSNSNLVVKRRIITRAASERLAGRTNNILLCAPSNGAVNELVLRIMTDGLLDSVGKLTKVCAPSVHPEALKEDFISIVRLGNAGEDAPEIVNSVCLPHIIRREMAIHPKAMGLRALQDTQRFLRSSIREFHNKANENDGKQKNRKELAKTHQRLTECTGNIRRLRDEMTAIRAKTTETILSKANIIACTLSKAGSGDFSNLKHGFDALIIDEAAQAVELSTLIPIRERVARVVLVGDPKQLPATVKSVVAAKARYDRSLFERIAESGVAPSMLRVQYRMHPFLREFPSKRFYGGLLTDGPSVMEQIQKTCSGVYARPSFQPFLLYDVENSREEDMNGSKYNREEAAFCINLCQNMFETCIDVRNNNWSVGFVSPYKEQVRVLRQEITRSKISASVSIEVNTVDGFQGREKDVIVFSCVRSSKRGGIGFLRDIRRLNVAITRARYCMYVVGNVDTLVRDETWAALVKSARDRRLVINTKGEPFSMVAKRLESDKYRDLAEHYQLMHSKAVEKCALIVKPKVAVSKAETIAQEAQSVGATQPSGVKATQSNDCVPQEGDERVSNSNASSKPLCDGNDSKQGIQKPTESHKRVAALGALDDKSFDDKSKRPRLSATELPTAVNLRDQYEIRSFRDRKSSSSPDMRQHNGYRAHKGTSGQDETRREASDMPSISYDDSSKGDDKHANSRTHREEDRFAFRDYRRSYDKEQNRRSEDKNWPDHIYCRNDRRDYGNRRRDSHREGSKSSRNVSREMSQSFSRKEYCQPSETLLPLKAESNRSTSPNTRRKRPYLEPKLFPPRPDRFTSRSSYRPMEKEPKRHDSKSKTSSGGSTNVLSNILSSAKQLATSTSRVNDKAHPKDSEFL